MAQSIHCDGCDYKKVVHFSHRIYILNKREYDGIPVRDTLGWCSKCGDVVAIETIASENQLEDELEQERRKEPGSGVFTQIPENWAKARLEWRRNRRSTARCLKCGSSEVEDLSNALVVDRGGISPKHPGCKNLGSFVFNAEDFVNLEEIEYYDAEGIRLPDYTGAG